MNDEDFARDAFAAAFHSGHTAEPPTLPDVESLVKGGRRASRQRHGVYAAGTTALAGVVTAGVVTAPTLLGFGGSSPSEISAGAGGTTAALSSSAPSSSAPDPAGPAGPAKPSSGVTCATPPAIDWASVLASALPAGLTATADHFANCVETSNGSRSMEALFTLSTGAAVQLNVNTGPDIAAKLNAAASAKSGIDLKSVQASPDPSEAALEASKLARAGLTSGPDAASSSASLDPAAIASLEAHKRALASASASLDAATMSSLDAQKHALANLAATSSDSASSGGSPDVVDNQSGSCSTQTPAKTVCVSHFTKGSLSVVDVQILRSSGNALVIDAIASDGKNAPTPVPGLLPSDATMVAIAEAVAAHF